MSPLASWSLVAIVVGLPSLVLYCALRVSDLALRRAMATAPPPLHTHTCSVCGRVQRWLEPFDQFSPCVACQLFDEKRHVEIDLDDFADADAIRGYLDGVEMTRVHATETM